MEAGGKRKKTSKADAASTSKTQKASKQDRSWCRDCWSRASPGCSSSQHALVDVRTALAEANASFDSQRRELEAAEERLGVVQAAAAEDNAVVLEVDVEGNDDSDCGGWYIEGGSAKITMAPVTAFSAKEKKAICDAFSGSDVWYSGDRGGDRLDGAYAACRLDLPKGILSKLPDRADGQTLPGNTILFRRAGSHNVAYIKIYYSEVMPHNGRGDKVFGRAADIEAFFGSGCDGACGSYQKRDCYCETGRTGSTTIEEARFLP